MIITLCGSARFEPGFHYWNERLTLAGHVVFSLAVYPSIKAAGKDWYTLDQKETLDRVHKLKIDASEAVFVLRGLYSELDDDRTDGRTPYIGESTRGEVKHAIVMNKKVFYEPFNWWEKFSQYGLEFN